jgi:transposase
MPPWHDTHAAKRELEQRLAPDHLARTIDHAVERLDLAALRALYHGTGSEPHPPERLLRVVLYEMRRGHHSPAQWHRDAHECEPVRWLLRGAVVARSCWYAFRDRAAPVLPVLHQQVLAQALSAGLTTATRAAEDGTLVAAQASRHKLLNQETLQRRAAQLAAAVAEDAPAVAGSGPALGTAARAPATTDGGAAAGPGVPPAVAATSPAAGVALPSPPVSAPVEPPARPAWMAATAAGRRQQQRRLEQARERLEELQSRNQQQWASKRKAAQAIVVSPSDPEAVVARDKEKVYRPLYNVQIIDDLESPLILGYGVFAQQNDTGVLAAMLAQVRQQLGHGLRVLLADGAYAGGADLAVAEREGVTVYAPVPGDGVKNPQQIPKREFVWQAAEQTYLCPQGHRLEFEESWRERRADGGVQVWRYRCPPEHCQGCPLQARCTKTPASGRAVTRLEHEDLIEALRARMAGAEAQAWYRLRKQTVELVNADMKQHRKLRRFSGRGLARARCEVGLVVLAHNLLTLVNEEQKIQAKQASAVAANAEPSST